MDNQTFQIPEQNEDNQTVPTSNQAVNTTVHQHAHPLQSHVPSSQLKKYSPLKWEQFFDTLNYLDNGTSYFTAGKQGALFFCIHGAGNSALSFARLAGQVKHYGTLVAFDFKGHGYSKCSQNIEDFTIESLVNETIEVLKQIMQIHHEKNVILVGHSMGGSVCARIADSLTNKQKQQRIQGAIIIDVVEGTAIQALPFMNEILNARPHRFDSIQSAIMWSLTSRTINKLQSARVSIPSQLRQVEINGLKQYQWKFNLKQTQKFWIGWFKDLSATFLRIGIPKILVTAEKERLDKQLTIAQMQGKFKLEVLYNVGHSVQEDDYKGVSKLLASFLLDFRIPQNINESQQKKNVGIAKFHPKVQIPHSH